MAESHVISGLASKRAELSCEIDYHQEQIKQIKKNLSSIDDAIKVFDENYDLRKIKSKRSNGKNNFFEPREGNTLLMDIFREVNKPISTQELMDEVISRKAFDTEVINVKALRASVFVILKRLQANKIVREKERDGLVIIWELVEIN